MNGNAISYDASGNPTNWYNGKSYTGLTWVNGRQLSAITTGGTRTTYAYDADGIRSSKTVGSTVHTYLTQSGKVVRETIGSGSSTTVLDFIYDESNRPFALNYSTNGGSSFTTYYYVLNLQGDVVKLVTSSDTAVATYTYDAWGNLLTSSGTMASVNPLRYRGYYYDTETGFYYVSSRYYDSEIGRFINADDIDYLGADGSPLSYNLFAYCMNDPINRFDVDGNWSLSNWVKVAIGVAAIAVGVCVTALTGGAALPALSAGVKAACVAGAISAGTSAAKTAVCSAMSGDSFSTVLHKSAKAAVDGFADGFMAGGIAAGASQVASGGFKIAAKLGAKTGKGGGIKIGDAKILSPDAAWHKNNGGTLLKIGNTFRIDVGSNTLLHMHLPNASSHIQIGTIGAGIYGGLK